MALAYQPQTTPNDFQDALKPQLLHEFFAMQARTRANHVALECGEKSLSYRALDDWSNQIAHELRARGVGPGRLVALLFPKTPELFAAILGVLKAGGGYVPIDPKFPRERIGDILEDSRAVLVLTSEALASAIPDDWQPRVLRLDHPAETAKITARSPAPLGGKERAKPDDICYVIFTSGSTGRPKGVMIEHRNAATFVRSLESVYEVGHEDRVYQGFSIAFDAAVEEVWAAWSRGGTLVVAPEDVARSPADAAAFIAAQRVSVFSTVPTFLAMIEDQLDSVQLLIVGGEACPPELVERWAGGARRMLNTYGPTEATVVATWTELSPDRPVTIGKALPGYQAYVLDEDGRAVAPGEEGELYIGGAGVARGYINRPDLNGERFIVDPFAGEGEAEQDGEGGAPARLYRTYDHVRLEENGEIAFLGRLDAQVKIRGFRVELSEIEAVLLDCDGVRAAATGVAEQDGIKTIAAYIVPSGNLDAIKRDEIAAHLRQHLPEYMVPKTLDILNALPVMTSGKVDRRALPTPKMLLSAGLRKMVPPQTKLEKDIAAIWQENFCADTVSIEDDFFLDLGGHSLIAARVVTELRSRLNRPDLSVRNLYQYPTIAKLAEHIEAEHSQVAENKQSAAPPRPRASEIFAAQSRSTRWLVIALQALAIHVYYAIIVTPFVVVLVMFWGAQAGDIAWGRALNNIFIMSFLAWPSMLLLSVALKWLVIGRYKPGRYPLWSFYYFRWWLVSRFQSLSWSKMFAGTPLMSLYYRAMGAKVGRNCTIATPLCTIFDLVEIGDDCTIGSETQMLGYRVEDGMLVIGHTTVGPRCFVGMHCNLGLGSVMGEGAQLDDLSALPDGAVIPAGHGAQGAPARPADVRVPEALPGAVRRRPILFGFIHLALIYAMGYFLILAVVPSFVLISSALIYGDALWAIGAAFLAVPIGIAWYLVCLVATKRGIIGRLRPGTHRLESVAYLRHWFSDYLLDNTRQLLMPLYATTYLPSVLRLLGARIGKNAEISTVLHISPDLLEIGESSFLADAALVGGKRVYNGVVEFTTNRIGARSFIGNSALVPGGVDIGEDSLVGVMSCPPMGGEAAADGLRWLGSPAFHLPHTQKDIHFDDTRTFHPTKSLQRLRATIDLGRILLPRLLGMGGLIAFAWLFVFAYYSLPLWATLAITPVLAVVFSTLAVFAAAAVKWIIMGRFKPIVQPLYSPFVWKNEVVNAVYEGVAAPSLMILMGTPFIAPLLRLMGCRIGRRTFLETTLFSEFDLVEIGDYAALNLGATIQSHLFEDRVMKCAPMRIGDNCSVGNMAVVLYGTEMQEGAWLGPLSLLLKGETLSAGSRWHGVPTQPLERNHQTGIADALKLSERRWHFSRLKALRAQRSLIGVREDSASPLGKAIAARRIRELSLAHRIELRNRSAVL